MRFLPILLSLSTAVPSAAQQPSADSARVYELHEVEVLPRPENAADFTAALQAGYPVHLRDSGVGGTVQVAFVVRPDGHPGDIRVLSTPDSAFDAPTVQAVSLLRFTPAQLRGGAVPVRVEQPITWRAEPAPAPVAAEAGAGGVPADTVRTLELSEVRELPRPLNTRAFQRELARSYPAPLRDAGITGTVHVRFRVLLDGTTNGAQVTRSTHPGFDEATLRALQVVRFTPGRVDGRPVQVWVELPIQWSLGPPQELPGLSPPPGERERPTFRPPSDPCRTERC
jgi:TonB family protein